MLSLLKMLGLHLGIPGLEESTGTVSAPKFLGESFGSRFQTFSNANGISTSSVKSLRWDRLRHADPSGLSTVEWRETGWCSSESSCQLTPHKHWLQPVPFSDCGTPSTYFTVSVGLEPGCGLTEPCALGSTLRLQTRCQPGYSHSRLSWRKYTSKLKCLLAELSSLGPSRMRTGVPLWCLAGGPSGFLATVASPAWQFTLSKCVS